MNRYKLSQRRFTGGKYPCANKYTRIHSAFDLLCKVLYLNTSNFRVSHYKYDTFELREVQTVEVACADLIFDMYSKLQWHLILLGRPVGLRKLYGQRLCCCYSQCVQYWMLSEAGEIRRDEACLDYTGQLIVTYTCHSMKGNQLWIYHTVIVAICDSYLSPQAAVAPTYLELTSRVKERGQLLYEKATTNAVGLCIT